MVSIEAICIPSREQIDENISADGNKMWYDFAALCLSGNARSSALKNEDRQVHF